MSKLIRITDRVNIVNPETFKPEVKLTVKIDVEAVMDLIRLHNNQTESIIDSMGGILIRQILEIDENDNSGE